MAESKNPDQPDMERIALWMMERGYATGHGDNIEYMLVELEWQAKEHGDQDR
jgi:hypothetical protein